MAYLKYALFVLGLMSILQSNAQNYEQFFVQIPNATLVPVTSHTYGGIKINSTQTIYKALNNLINSYEIYSVETVFNNTQKTSLQNMYLIHCNDLQLMTDLYANYSQYYTLVEDAGVELLALPDDFGTTGGYTNTDQDELSYIRAPEAWEITPGSSDVFIGISDNSVQTQHEDLQGKVQLIAGNNFPNTPALQHGSFVTSIAAANTDNTKGMSAIGYNSSVKSVTHNWVNGVDILSETPGVKVINTAWISNAMPETYNEAVEDRGVVVVASAGNGQGGAGSYINPAAFKNVISVSAIGHHTASFVRNSVLWELTEDAHEVLRNGEIRTFQHNDSVDIVAPAYGVLLADPRFGLDTYLDNGLGTSYASPMVSGTIALMFSVNYCIDPKEVESILKLTAVKIDNLPFNTQYYGKLGAGKLDAYEAVKMAKDMADDFGTVEVKDRILYRWFYKLETAPYEIKMTNNDITGNARLKFKARNNIELLSGDYYPDSGGYVDLAIDETLQLNDCPTPPTARLGQLDIKTKKDADTNFYVYPTLVEQQFTVKVKNEALAERYNAKIYNFFGKLVLEEDNITEIEKVFNFKTVNSGIYILKIYDERGDVIQTNKIVKN